MEAKVKNEIKEEHGPEKVPQCKHEGKPHVRRGDDPARLRAVALPAVPAETDVADRNVSGARHGTRLRGTVAREPVRHAAAWPCSPGTPLVPGTGHGS